MLAKKVLILVFCLFAHEICANSESTKRGANYFFIYCSACHSLKYAPTDLWRNQLQPQEPWRKFLNKSKWQPALTQQDAEHWFGRVPPDLSLIVLQHSKSWVIDYLNGFYLDTTHPLGRNNSILDQVAMPDVLYNLGESREAIVNDIADFLDYVASPEMKIRHYIGLGVMAVCFLAIWVTWFLKKILKINFLE
jgi:hypothetical protein